MIVVHNGDAVEVGHNTHVGTTPDEVFILVNQIYTLFDEGYITHEQCCLALGLTPENVCEACGVEVPEPEACGDPAEYLCPDCYTSRLDAQEEDAHDGRREDRREREED